MNQDPKLHWKQQVAERRAKLEHVRSALRVASERHLRSGADTDADAVVDLATRERLAEQALDYADEQLKLASSPRPVIIHSSREALGQQRRQVEQRMAYRQKVYDEQVANERQKCGRMPEHHIKIHLQNVLSQTEFGVRRDNAADQRILDDVAAQLAAHDAEDARNAQGAA